MVNNFQFCESQIASWLSGMSKRPNFDAEIVTIDDMRGEETQMVTVLKKCLNVKFVTQDRCQPPQIIIVAKGTRATNVCQQYSYVGVLFTATGRLKDYVFMFRFHVTHNLSSHFNNTDTERYYPFIIHGYRQATT